MKTNHQRNFKENKSPKRYAASPMGMALRKSNLADKVVLASWGGDNSNGHRGYAKAKRGGKKFLNSRIRFHENNALRQLTKEKIDERDSKNLPLTPADRSKAALGDPLRDTSALAC